MTDTHRGALWMMASMAGFAFNDTAFKLAAADVPFYQAIFIRGMVASLLLGLIAAPKWAAVRHVSRADWTRIGLRTIAELIAVYCFLTALLHVPLANLTAVIQMLPLTIALAAALFMAEPTGPRRIAAIVAGFLGVMLIIRPGTEGFNSYIILGVVAVATVTVRDLVVRRIAPTVPTSVIALVTAVAITLWAGSMKVLTQEPWVRMENWPFLYLLGAAGFVFAATYCSVQAMRVGEIAAVTPFRYTVMVWAVALGWLAFGEIPDLWAGVGIVIIVMAGLYTLRRQ